MTSELALASNFSNTTDSSIDSTIELHEMVDDLVEDMENAVDWIAESSPEELSEIIRYYNEVARTVQKQQGHISNLINDFIYIINSRPQLKQAGGSMSMGMLSGRMAQKRNKKRAENRKKAYEKKKAEDERQFREVQQKVIPNNQVYGVTHKPTSFSASTFIAEQEQQKELEKARLKENEMPLSESEMYFYGVIVPIFIFLGMLYKNRYRFMRRRKGGKSMKLKKQNKTVKKRVKL
uniref:Uncharacterized protein n=1 Tax=viral metagenome TaxID=1070528 RepID=A0A6C0AZT4_9ZZZZ